MVWVALMFYLCMIYFCVLVYIHFIFVSSWHVVGRVHHGRDGQRNSAVSWHWPYPSLGPRVSVQPPHLILLVSNARLLKISMALRELLWDQMSSICKLASWANELISQKDLPWMGQREIESLSLVLKALPYCTSVKFQDCFTALFTEIQIWRHLCS